ncbi:MAG: GntR family transcriptional regulator [Chloroflexota bacterium]
MRQENATEWRQNATASGHAIQPFSPVPLYIQLSEAIKQTIASGALRAGQELPSENQLCETYGVSRITVRQALAELVSDGTATRRRPRGPLFVNPPRILREVTQASGPFVESVLVGNVKRRTELISATVERAPAYQAAQLELPIGTQCYRAALLHSGDEEPLCLQVSWMPEELVPGFLAHDLTAGSLRGIFEKEYGLSYARKLQRISARTASNDESALLRVERRAPILELERRVLVTDGRTIELVTYALRADRFTVVADLGRPPDLDGDR